MVKVLHYVSKMDRGGQETFVMNVFRNVDREKVQFDFLCTHSDEGDYDAEIRTLGGQIRYIQLNRISGKLKQLDNTKILYHYLKKVKNEYRVFHIHTQHAMDAFLSAFAAKRAGIPKVVVHSHSISTVYSVSAHQFFKHFLAMENIFRFACSEEAGKWMYKKNNFQIVHNSIDLKQFTFDQQKRDDIRKEMGWENMFVIGHVGRLNREKNHLYLIDIFREVRKRIPESHLVLVGRGELEEEIQKKVQEYDLEDAVSLMGVRSDVERLYQGMDLFLFPSLFEGLGVVLVEAQTSDLPCVISDTIPSEVDITDKIHRMDIKDTPEKWANKIAQIFKEQPQRRDTSDMIRKAGYDMQQTAKELEQFYCR